jgi:hypothetical protein
LAHTLTHLFFKYPPCPPSRGGIHTYILITFYVSGHNPTTIISVAEGLNPPFTDIMIHLCTAICFKQAKSKAKMPRFKVEMSRFKVEMPRFKVEMSRFNVEMSRFNVEMSRFKVEMSRFKVEMSRFKVEMSRFKACHASRLRCHASRLSYHTLGLKKQKKAKFLLFDATYTQ